MICKKIYHMFQTLRCFKCVNCSQKSVCILTVGVKLLNHTKKKQWRIVFYSVLSGRINDSLPIPYGRLHRFICECRNNFSLFLIFEIVHISKWYLTTQCLLDTLKFVYSLTLRFYSRNAINGFRVLNHVILLMWSILETRNYFISETNSNPCSQW